MRIEVSSRIRVLEARAKKERESGDLLGLEQVLAIAQNRPGPIGLKPAI
ncbi:MAG: hypothetical protein ACYDAL_14920 [Candidatus Dormibacteraceae bacterium]